jgi:hypothetical protein
VAPPPPPLAEVQADVARLCDAAPPESDAAAAAHRAALEDIQRKARLAMQCLRCARGAHARSAG